MTALISGYMLGQVFPDTFNSAVPSPLYMILFCVIFSFGVAYIAFRGVGGTTGVNAAINVIQITALLVFSIMAIAYRVNHPEGSRGWTLDPGGNPVNVVLKVDDKGARMRLAGLHENLRVAGHEPTIHLDRHDRALQSLGDPEHHDVVRPHRRLVAAGERSRVGLLPEIAHEGLVYTKAG